MLNYSKNSILQCEGYFTKRIGKGSVLLPSTSFSEYQDSEWDDETRRTYNQLFHLTKLFIAKNVYDGILCVNDMDFSMFELLINKGLKVSAAKALAKEMGQEFIDSFEGIKIDSTTVKRRVSVLNRYYYDLQTLMKIVSGEYVSGELLTEKTLEVFGFKLMRMENKNVLLLNDPVIELMQFFYLPKFILDVSTHVNDFGIYSLKVREDVINSYIYYLKNKVGIENILKSNNKYIFLSSLFSIQREKFALSSVVDNFIVDEFGTNKLKTLDNSVKGIVNYIIREMSNLELSPAIRVKDSDVREFLNNLSLFDIIPYLEEKGFSVEAIEGPDSVVLKNSYYSKGKTYIGDNIIKYYDDCRLKKIRKSFSAVSGILLTKDMQLDILNNFNGKVVNSLKINSNGNDNYRQLVAVNDSTDVIFDF